MIHIILSIVLSCLFVVLATFHFYWFLGGKWGLKKVIPTVDKQSELPTIPRLATGLVALLLTLFGFVYLLESEYLSFSVSSEILQWSSWFITSLFIVRAIGEFKFIGLFKKINDTEFAKADTWIFTPLCLIIALLGVLIHVLP